MLRAPDVISKKRDKKSLSSEEINFFIEGYVAGDIADYQASALLMACYLNGLSSEETGFLTRAMINSGTVFNFKMDKALVDKHSTGGVGDKISLPLAPLAAAMGLNVPMMSGRALGITGGTLDKLESMVGYRTILTASEFELGIRADGYAMTGQSADVVPADRLLYALRDVTATVESIPLITASILSKKFAEGSEALVFDVKCGSGAFMKEMRQAEELAQSLVATAKSLGRRAVALITNMDEPLGFMTGNFLEIEESVRCLEGQGPDDVMELVYRQAAYMALVGKVVHRLDDALELARNKIEDGSALKLWWRNIERQGGNVALVKSQLGNRRGRYQSLIKAPCDGYISNINAGIIGLSAVILGVGRNKSSDNVDFDAGFHFLKKSSAAVKKDEVIGYLYASDSSRLEGALACATTAYHYSSSKPDKKQMVILKEMTDC